MWNSIVSVPGHCLFYLLMIYLKASQRNDVFGLNRSLIHIT